jgi:asparagine synthetase A
MYNFKYNFFKGYKTMNTTEMVETMMAKEDGKNIQMRAIESDEISDWELVYSPSWDWENFQYRVLINNIEAYFFEYLKDNIWTLTKQRYADYQMSDLAKELEYDNFKRVDGLGIREIEDTRDIE